LWMDSMDAIDLQPTKDLFLNAGEAVNIWGDNKVQMKVMGKKLEWKDGFLQFLDPRQTNLDPSTLEQGTAALYVIEGGDADGADDIELWWAKHQNDGSTGRTQISGT